MTEPARQAAEARVVEKAAAWVGVGDKVKGAGAWAASARELVENVSAPAAGTLHPMSAGYRAPA